nr:MAG TPA: hypothetical protein [Caudoviricetes sp.]
MNINQLKQKKNSLIFLFFAYLGNLNENVYISN